MTMFSWMLYPHHEYLPVLGDDFIVGHFRLRLRGNSLHVEVEAPRTKDAGLAARELAEKYATTLATHLAILLRLLTIEEFGSLLAESVTVRGLRPGERGGIEDAIRKARHVLMASEDETLRRCYDYLQDARGRPEESLFSLYKVIEAIEHPLGGERKAIETLKIGSDVKFVKKLANEPVRDERHAPKTEGAIRHPETTDKTRALEAATRIVRAYEQYIRHRRA
jgi:hypothetical protein